MKPKNMTSGCEDNDFFDKQLFHEIDRSNPFPTRKAGSKEKKDRSEVGPGLCGISGGRSGCE
jgi:hypothetical protein